MRKFNYISFSSSDRESHRWDKRRTLTQLYIWSFYEHACGALILNNMCRTSWYSAHVVGPHLGQYLVLWSKNTYIHAECSGRRWCKSIIFTLALTRRGSDWGSGFKELSISLCQSAADCLPKNNDIPYCRPRIWCGINFSETLARDLDDAVIGMTTTKIELIEGVDRYFGY